MSGGVPASRIGPHSGSLVRNLPRPLGGRVRPHSRARDRQECLSPAFTLVEMLIVMGIIVIVILLAIPAIQSITGTRSVGAAQNTLSALITRAREEAVGLQEPRGIMFYIDPASDRVCAAIVREVPPNVPDANNPAPLIYLDCVPDRDYLPLPNGIVRRRSSMRMSPRETRHI